MNSIEDCGPELSDIREMLTDIHSEIRTFIEHSNKQHLDTVASFIKNDYSNVLAEHLMKDANESLDKGMVKKCKMRNDCKSNFNDFLQNGTELLKQENVPEETISEKRTQLEMLRKNAPFDKCNKCFSEVSDLFSKQVGMMRSLRIYDSSKVEKQEISEIPSKTIVNEVLEPLCHQKRFEILKALSTETRNFSYLSELTALRGGNLLFHLQKLMDQDMIMQKHERGDYMITARGFRVLKGISEIYSGLDAPEVEADDVE
ncbi:ArsR family transcriptional regulator [Methanolobus sp. ZRKC3]|uniref:ArsR family transcriptional regulator n=1 Tax=Methanolobus sp. ZRKC3 TaxID=3125786 RepID=UPI0032434321